VQNADETNLCTQLFWVGRNFEHGGSAGAEEQVIEKPGVAQTPGIQLVRQSEYNMKVWDVEKFLLARGEPALELVPDISGSAGSGR
jgi:hypothetical protein